MGVESEAAIAMAEAAYDLSVPNAQWLPHVIEAGLPLLDGGFGVAGLVGRKSPIPGAPLIEQMHAEGGARDFLMHVMRVMAELPPEKVHAQTESGIRLLSELIQQEPRYVRAWSRHIDYAEDAIGITALDCNGHGVHLMAASSTRRTLGQRERNRWRMLAAHLCTGLRLRSGPGPDPSTLPCGADAVVDSTDMNVKEAAATAQDGPSLEAIRHAAAEVDRARGRLRKDDPDEALAIWKALVRGRWSMVDWFDSDARRYILAYPNPPPIRDPRGLTEREIQVAEYAAMGERHKIIGYRLGIDRSTVTNALRSAMRKLGAKTQAQLVAKLRVLSDWKSSAGRTPPD